VLNPADIDVLLAELDREIEAQLRIDAIKAASRCTTADEAADVLRRFEAAQDGDAPPAVARLQ
jgi:hypothetical protein